MICGIHCQKNLILLCNVKQSEKIWQKVLTKFSLCVILFKRREQSEYSSGASKNFLKKLKKVLDK